MEQGKTTNPRLQAILDAARARTAKMIAERDITAVLPASSDLVPKPTTMIVDRPVNDIITMNGNTFNPYEIEGLILNEQQRLAVRLFGLEGKSGCLIGPAGTGKTTTMRALIRAAILSGRIPIIPEDIEHKYLRGGLPGIFGGSFTRIATRNLRTNCPADIQGNIHTIHRLLEYEPEIIEVYDEVLKKEKRIRIFKPTRHQFRPLPEEIYLYVLDESSMIGYTNLHAKLIAAINPKSKAQMLYIGDIAQLPPVMDDAVLGYKMLEFLKPEHNSLVELTQVYRHAGSIVNLANRVRVGKVIPDGKAIAPYSANPNKMPLKVVREWYRENNWNILEDNIFTQEEDGSKITVQYWKNRLVGDDVGKLRALQNLGLSFVPKQIEEGKYNPMTDMILMPYNKAVGTIELNRYIAGYLGKKRKAEVYEVVAGYVKHYFAIGDKVFYEREEAIISEIKINGMYAGKAPQAHSVTLDRWGHNTAGAGTASDTPVDDIEFLLNININEEDDEERKHQASHIVKVKKLVEIQEDGEDAQEYDLNTASEINELLFGYALTIHKAQGSQWPKVYCIFHNSHNRNLQRELLYTAITRAQKELYIICEPETLVQGVISQHIVGNTLAEKAEYFKGKITADKARKQLFAEDPVEENNDKEKETK
jgi:ABC-type oligopeptide transport system ATPase subunit